MFLSQVETTHNYADLKVIKPFKCHSHFEHSSRKSHPYFATITLNLIGFSKGVPTNSSN